MGMVNLVKHDHGCKWGRFEGEVNSRGDILEGGVGYGHTDAAKRMSDWYNLHKASGQVRGWIAVSLADGASDGEVYDSKQEAVNEQWPNENWFFYCTLTEPSMSVCAAESLLRYKRVMNKMESGHVSRDAPHGGLEVIPRISVEDMEAQIRAIRTGQGALALGYKRG